MTTVNAVISTKRNPIARYPLVSFFTLAIAVRMAYRTPLAPVGSAVQALSNRGRVRAAPGSGDCQLLPREARR